MNPQKNVRIRNRTTILLLLPVTIFLWLIGWTLFWTGSKTKPTTPKHATETKSPLTIGVLLEEPENINA